jgi:hypothetical protein
MNMVYRHSTQKRRFDSLIHHSLGIIEKITKKNYNLECVATIKDLEKLLSRLKPEQTKQELIKLGEGDGSYFVPDDLVDIGHCISPGFGGLMTFEIDLFEKFGIQSTIIDREILEESPIGINFLPYFIDSYSDSEKETISLDDVISGLNDSFTKDLILQMDIEGNEWMVLRSLSVDTLKRFRLIVLELHSLPILRDRFLFDKVVAPSIDKILDSFKVVFAKAHTPSGFFSFDGKTWYPDTLEVTFQRR